MSGKKGERELSIYTIGHSNYSIDVFINLLKAHKIELLVDVRSHPHSKYAVHFDKRPLLHAVKSAGIKYQFAGKELGGMPDQEEFYDKDGYVLYSRIAASQPFRDGIERLMEEIQDRKVAILCSEENPSECHRRHLVGRVLYDRGVDVLHILKDGSIVTEDELRAEESQKASNQLSLFGDKEEKEWKSTQSVLKKEKRPNFSES